MGAVQENRPQLQLRRPAGREPLHNTSAAAALVVRDTPVVSRVPGVPSVPSVPRFTAVPQFVPNMADTVGALRRVGRNPKAERGDLSTPKLVPQARVVSLSLLNLTVMVIGLRVVALRRRHGLGQTRN